MAPRIVRETIRSLLRGMSLNLILLLWIVPLSLGVGEGTGSPASAEATNLRVRPIEEKWNELSGGPGTSCAMGAAYSFFTRSRDPHRLLIHFQGGGACWNSVNCDLRQNPTFKAEVNQADRPRPSGIFDLDNPENPFKDFTIVVVPYCTGDVHLGNRVATYPRPPTGSNQASTLQIQHKGYPNAMAAIRWAFTNLPSPSIVFVSGESAGAIASPFFAAVVAGHYRTSRVVQLGDSGGGYRTPAVTQLLENWGAIKTIRSVKPYRREKGRINFETLYIAATGRLPTARFSQFNTTEDSTQLFFLRLVGVVVDSLEPMLDKNLADIREASPTFHTYTAPGKTHGILSSPEFYTLEVNGIRFQRWVAEMAQGRAIRDVKATTRRNTSSKR